MSLDFDLSAVKTLPNGDDPTHHPFNKTRWHAVGDALVWGSMSVGLNRITEENTDKWVQRLNLLQAIDGPPLQVVLDGVLTGVYVTEADVKAFIGLHTNASNISDIEFAKRLLRVEPKLPVQGRPAYEIAHEAALKASKGKTIELEAAKAG